MRSSWQVLTRSGMMTQRTTLLVGFGEDKNKDGLLLEKMLIN